MPRGNRDCGLWLKWEAPALCAGSRWRIFSEPSVLCRLNQELAGLRREPWLKGDG